MKPPHSQKLYVKPITIPVANTFIEEHHRHHGPLPGGFAWFCVGAILEDGRLVGVAVAGRPTNRNNDDGWTIEVLRLATDGTMNAPSLLLGACARAGRAIGARRIVTYTLDDETGASLRGAGWVRSASGIRSWWWHAGARKPAIQREHFERTKSRWELPLEARTACPGKPA